MAVSDPIRFACHCGARLVLPRLERWYTCAACARRWRATVGLETRAGGLMQAKDIPDAAMLAVLTDQWQPTGHITPHFPAVPEKVVQAKLRQLHKRRLVHGCDCGCRGDWHLARVHCPCGDPPPPAPPRPGEHDA